MYAEYDHEDGYEMLANLTSGAFSKAYLRESEEEKKERLKQEYDEMLLAKKFKVKPKHHLSEYDKMLMGHR